jgi:hypothetical protein
MSVRPEAAARETLPPNNSAKRLNCRMMRLLRPLVLLVLLFSARAVAQQGPFSMGLQAGVSYSGWNLALVGQYNLDDFSAYLGPSISLNRGLPGKGPIGLNTGLNYHLPSSKKWISSLVNMDYQLHFFSLAASAPRIIHEFHLSYGLEFHITESLCVVQQLGYGGYLESNPVATGGRKSFSGYGGLVRLKAGYRF